MKLGYFAPLVLFAFAFPAEACTSWLLRSENTESGMMILHKIVDGRYSPRDADIRTAPNGWRWLRIGGYHGGHSNMALNEKGVAITTNGGDPNGLKNSAERNTPVMTWDQIRDLSTNGMEIASHGWAHARYAKMGRDDIIDDIRRNQVALKENAGVDCVSFASPFNTKKSADGFSSQLAAPTARN